MRRPFGEVIGNALRLRCPNCQRGPVFTGWLNNVLPQCPVCGLPYYRESGYYMGGMILTYIVAAFVLLVAYLISLFFAAVNALPVNTKLAAGGVLAVALTVGLVRPCYSLWLSVDFWIAPWKRRDSE